MSDAAREHLWQVATRNRLLAADLLETLSPEQWATPSLCAGWTVREVAAHLVDPLVSDLRLHRVLLAMLRYRGDLDRMVDEQTRAVARQPVRELVTLLREHAHDRLDPPFIGAPGPMTDTAVHLRDMARPLGSDVGPAIEDWRPVLDFVVSAPTGFVPRRRLTGLRFRATDQDWRHGEGAEVAGSSEALALAVTGRTVVLDDLTGPGVPMLRDRLA